jgi:hypothetical protein
MLGRERLRLLRALADRSRGVQAKRLASRDGAHGNAVADRRALELHERILAIVVKLRSPRSLPKFWPAHGPLVQADDPIFPTWHELIGRHTPSAEDLLAKIEAGEEWTADDLAAGVERLREAGCVLSPRDRKELRRDH